MIGNESTGGLVVHAGLGAYTTDVPKEIGMYWVWQPKGCYPCMGSTYMVHVAESVDLGLVVSVPGSGYSERLQDIGRDSNRGDPWHGAHWLGPVEPPAVFMNCSTVTDDGSPDMNRCQRDCRSHSDRCQPETTAHSGDQEAVDSAPVVDKGDNVFIERMPENWFVGMSESYREEAWRIAQMVRRKLVDVPTRLPTAYVEVRECGVCGHVGINDASESKSACVECNWRGDSPTDDTCPGCGKASVMTASCPTCMHRYMLVDSKSVECSGAALTQTPVEGDAVAKAKRIMALVDSYIENPTSASRWDIRSALISELEFVSKSQLISTSPEFAFAAMCRGEIALPQIEQVLELYEKAPGYSAA